MHTVKKLTIPIYEGILHIVFSTDFNLSAKRLKIKTDLNLNNYGAFAESGVSKKGTCLYYIVLPPDVSHSLIAHEVVHIVNYIFADRHIKHDLYNDEPQALLTGYITEQVYNYKFTVSRNCILK